MPLKKFRKWIDIRRSYAIALGLFLFGQTDFPWLVFWRTV